MKHTSDMKPLTLLLITATLCLGASCDVALSQQPDKPISNQFVPRAVNPEDRVTTDFSKEFAQYKAYHKLLLNYHVATLVHGLCLDSEAKGKMIDRDCIKYAHKCIAKIETATYEQIVACVDGVWFENRPAKEIR